MKHVVLALFVALPALVRASTPAYPVPVNDRLPVGGGRCQQSITINNKEGGVYGSYDLPNPECGPFAGGDVWLVADAPSSGKLVVEGGYSDFSLTRMAFYAYRQGELIALACAFPSQLHQVPKTLLTDLKAGEVIFIRIWDAGNDEVGEAEICAYDPEGFSRPSRGSLVASESAKNASNLTVEALPAFPNPAGEGLSVPLATAEHHAQVTLTDMSGRTVLRTDAREQALVQLNLANVQDGLYVLRVETQAGIRTELLRVQH